MDSKPTTITAAQLLNELDKWAILRDEGKCNLVYNGNFIDGIGVVNDEIVIQAGGIATDSDRNVSPDALITVTWLPQQPATASEDTAPTGAGETDYRDLYMSAGGSLAIIASWLRGSRGDMDDLTTQNIYDMIADEQGMKAQTITTVLVEQAELAALREQVAALTGALRSIAGTQTEKPERISYDTGNSDDRQEYGYLLGLWGMGEIAREALAAVIAEGGCVT